MPKPTHISSRLASVKIKSKTLWADLIGSPQQLSLESRVFHSICIALMLLVSLYIPYNLYAGLYVGSLSALIVGLFFFYQYYLSRFKGKPHSTTIFALTGLFIFGINYFTNSGIHGSTDLIWPAYLLLVLAISPYQHHLKWLIIYLVSFLILHFIAYKYPALVQYPFKAGQGQFIDRITAFPIPVFVVYIIIRFIRKSYDAERQATIEKTQALEWSNSEKTKLMSIISHDLRSPLINIQNYLQLLNENQVDDTERPMLEKSLMQSTNGAVQMLSNFLHWSKSQMEGAGTNMVLINLSAALHSTLEMENVTAAKKNIILNVNIPDQLMIYADVDMLQLVVRNLISNAIKFTPAGGKIEISAEQLSTECRITVADNGCGISAEKQQKLFSAHTESTYGTDNEKGVGLGLALCKEFIERQGGRITFESTLNQGSSFFLFVQLNQK
ncbi:sensor histidine kinase [Pedobacter africanus]|uniref:histidine kinase n=1 Tax=Pedobacter africanus TaxID=151894 RepID=A0A1W1ZK88_9SPHI|nr:HAMP domain-containing sensor histidine kinase [Pedobacter africanus]SMC48508.1 Signal transduction histidine kinase [Pedobacter africanus]